MRVKLVALLVLSGVLFAGCGENAVEKQGLGPGEIAKWNDPNYQIIGVGAYNYTDYDIYDVFILPPDKDDIIYAAIASGDQATPRDSERWGLGGAAGANLAWDYSWKTPRKYKIWWLRIVDMKMYSESAKGYDKYKMKTAQPGTAWCEGEINVRHPPVVEKSSYLIIHYFPDGHLDGDIIHIDGDASQVDIKKRTELPTLRDQACLKEIPNPYFEKTKPIGMH